MTRLSSTIALRALYVSALLAPAVAAQQFGPVQFLATNQTNTQSVRSADLDGDGDRDVVCASWQNDRVSWFENLDGLGTFGPAKIVSSATDGARVVGVGDLDGDGDQDLVCCSDWDDKVRWFENLDGLGNFSTPKLVSGVHAPRSLDIVDLDGDQDLDLLVGSYFDNEVLWFDNTNGQGNFSAKKVISNQAKWCNAVRGADVDGDGDMDVLSASQLDSKVAWYENVDGLGNFGAQLVISSNAAGARWVAAADLDGDGDVDALSASTVDTKVAWYENTDGSGAFGAEQILSLNNAGPRVVEPADVDGDGDLDVLAGFYGDDLLAWFENTDGAASFGPAQTIATGLNGIHGLEVADIDGDNDLDVTVATWLGSEIAWVKNGPAGLVGTPASISVASGGTQALSLNAGSAFAGLPYLVLGSWSGTSPGTPLDGQLLPLNTDPYTNITLLTPNVAPLSGTFGTLDAAGAASASFSLPTGLSPGLAGLTLNHAYVVIELLPTLLQLVYISNPVPLDLVP